jgi:hypothetical protein
MKVSSSLFGLLSMVALTASHAFAINVPGGASGYDNVTASSANLPVMTAMHDMCVAGSGFNVAVKYVPLKTEATNSFTVKGSLVPTVANPNPSLSGFRFYINIWSGNAALHANPFLGNFYSSALINPSSAVVVPGSGSPIYKLTFSLPSLELQANRDYWISITAFGSTQAYPQCSPATGSFAIQESGNCANPSLGGTGKIFSESTAYWAPNYWNYTANVYPPRSAACGALGDPATQLNTTELLMFGDMDCNGAVNLNDVLKFYLALVDPAAFAAQSNGCSIRHGDFNGDNLINSSDLEAFENLF